MSTQQFTAGSVEYLSVTVTADATLDTQPVAVSIDHGVTWLPCVWQGSAGTSRKARTSNPITFAESTRPATVLVKVTDSPEVPIIKAGSFTVAKK